MAPFPGALGPAGYTASPRTLGSAGGVAVLMAGASGWHLGAADEGTGVGAAQRRGRPRGFQGEDSARTSPPRPRVWVRAVRGGRGRSRWAPAVSPRLPARKNQVQKSYKQRIYSHARWGPGRGRPPRLAGQCERQWTGSPGEAALKLFPNSRVAQDGDWIGQQGGSRVDQPSASPPWEGPIPEALQSLQLWGVEPGDPQKGIFKCHNHRIGSRLPLGESGSLLGRRAGRGAVISDPAPGRPRPDALLVESWAPTLGGRAWGLVTTLLRTVNHTVNDSALRAPSSPSSRPERSLAM